MPVTLVRNSTLSPEIKKWGGVGGGAAVCLALSLVSVFVYLYALGEGFWWPPRHFCAGLVCVDMASPWRHSAARSPQACGSSHFPGKCQLLSFLPSPGHPQGPSGSILMGCRWFFSPFWGLASPNSSWSVFTSLSLTPTAKCSSQLPKSNTNSSFLAAPWETFASLFLVEEC